MNKTRRRKQSAPSLIRRLVIGLFMVGLVLPQTAAAQPAQEGDPAPAAEARGLSQIVLAAELAAWGRSRGDAEALRLAARMLDEVPVRRSSAGDPDLAPVLSAAALREEAAALQRGRALEEVVVSGSRITRPASPTRPAVAAPPPPPPPPPPPAPPPPPPPPPPALGVRSSPFGAGPVSTVKQLASRQRWGFEVEARPAEVLRVAAIGDGDTDIDLIVLDARGRTVCTDRFGDHYPVCTIPPGEGARMRIDIVNRGPIGTRVQILTN